MRFSSTSLHKTLCVTALIPLFTACVNLAPGMRIDHQQPAQSAEANVTPIIKLITPDLIVSEKASRAQLPQQDLSALIGTPVPYTIGRGDILSILVWDHPELSVASIPVQSLASNATNFVQTPAGFVVDHNGMVQFPFVGPIRLAGLTELEARNLLADKLVRVIKKPDITLRVQSFRSKRIYVDGEVKTPGNQVIDDVPMTLLEGLTRAGGFVPTADQSEIHVNRAGTTYRINLPSLVQRGIDPSGIMLTSGDVVHVRARDENKIFVLGEVTTPKALPMVNGRMTLNQALGEVGGVNPLSSEARQVYVIRNADAKNPLVYNLDARSPVALALAENFELNPKDVVYVDASGLARFSRIVNLIIPSSAAVTTLYRDTR
jgi:polysaccharide export outer membrane protein